MLTAPYLLPFLLLISPIAAKPRTECALGSKPPTNPSYAACQTFLMALAAKAHEEPKGAYRWYGRDLDTCPECVRLPSAVQYGRIKCALLLDVDDEHEKDVAIFGLGDLWSAASEIMGRCWIRKKMDGRAFPEGQSVWARFMPGRETIRGEVGEGVLVSRAEDGEREGGNGMVRVVDLDRWGGFVNPHGT